MIVFQREPVVERTIDFIAKFVTSVNPDPEVPGTDKDDSLLDEVSQNRLLLNMFEFLLKVTLLVMSPLTHHLTDVFFCEFLFLDTG